MKLEQWHSKSINGIRQELYCLFWLMNYARIQMNKCQERAKILLTEEYEKPNFKLILNWIKGKIAWILKRKRGLLKQIKLLINKSTERRKHYSRSYPRVLKGPASPYPRRNTIWAWPA